MNYYGTIIEESLRDKSILTDFKITATRFSPVEEKDKTPWLKKWTLHSVEIPEAKAGEIAKKLSRALDSKHSGSWYADYKNEKWHYVIFLNKIFKVDRTKKEEYDEVTRYGITLGIPGHQLDFSPEIK